MQPVASFSVANINPGVARTEFWRSIIALIDHERTQARLSETPRVRFDQFLDRHAGPYLDDERNQCVAWFLDSTSSDFLVFQDSDVAPASPDAYYRLIQAAVDAQVELVSGVYFNQFDDGLRPVLYRWEEGQLVHHTPKDLSEWRDNEAGLMPVDAAGAGFLAIHRGLLKRIGDRFGAPTPWFAEVALNGTHLGEDMTFCVRSAHVGGRPYADLSVVVDHYKTCCIRGEEG